MESQRRHDSAYFVK